MRTFGFLLACAFFFMSPALIVPTESASLPGAGTFTYDGAPLAAVAHLTLAVRDRG